MRKLIGIAIVVSVMVSMVACCKDENKSESNTTSEVTTSGENVIGEKDTSESPSENSNGLTDEKLLALPETDVKEFYYKEAEGDFT